MEHGADINAKDGFDDAVDALLQYGKYGAKINARDKSGCFGKTPLSVAIMQGYSEVVEKFF